MTENKLSAAREMSPDWERPEWTGRQVLCDNCGNHEVMPGLDLCENCLDAAVQAHTVAFEEAAASIALAAEERDDDRA